MQQLASRGHDITLALEDWEVETGFRKKGNLDNLRYNLLINKVHPTPEEGYKDFAFKRDRLASPEAAKNPILALSYILEWQAEQCVNFVKNPETSKKLETMEIDLVIADFSHPCGVIIADMKNVPYIIFSPTSLLEPLTGVMVGVDIPPSTFPMHGSGLQVPMKFGQRMLNFALYHFTSHFIAPKMFLNNLRHQFHLPLRTTYGDARLFLLNSDFAVEFPVSLPPLFKTVGPLLAAPAKPLPSKLENIMKSGRAGAIYASFGSAFVLDKKEEVFTFVHALSTLASKNYAILWRIQDQDLPIGAKLIDLNLSFGIHVLDWGPQNDILGSSYLSAFITHGGTNGCYEAAWHGVPIVNIPFASDHMDHAAKVEWRKYGRTVARTTLAENNSTALVDAVDSVISDPTYKKNAEKVGKMLRGYAKMPAERAADWVEYALQMPNDGSGDLKDISGQLNWFVLHSVDMWAVYLGIMGVVFMALVGIVNFTWKIGRYMLRAAKQKLE